MVKIFGAYIDNLPNKFIISMHMIAYLFIIIANLLDLVKTPATGLKFFEISEICMLVVYFVCTLIFGLIVNGIVTNIEKSTIRFASVPSSLPETETSFQDPE